MKIKTRYARHLDRWSECTRCPLHKTRDRIVLYRGKLPAEVAFFGEAPGDAENLRGSPFRGMAGHKLNSIIEEAWEMSESDAKYIIGNLVACLPSAKVAANDPNVEDSGSWEPAKKEITDCMPRVVEFLKIVQPKLVVALGKHAAQYLPKIVAPGTNVLKLIHPAAILRNPSIVSASRQHRQCVSRLATALHRLEISRG